MSKPANQSTCHKCKKKGHSKSKCHHKKISQRKITSKGKSMMATKCDFDDSKLQENANTCSMVNEEVPISEPCPLCKEMEVEFYGLLNDSKSLSQKSIFLENQLFEIKKENEKLQILNDKYFKIIQELQYSHLEMFEQQKILKEEQIINNLPECSMIHEENVVLKENVLDMKNDITSSAKSAETFQNIKESQVVILDKTSLGCRTFQKQNLYENFFVPHKDQKIQRYKCSYCHKYGHVESFCFKKRFKRKEHFHQKQEHSQKVLKMHSYSKISYKRSSYHHKKKSCKRNNTNPQGPRSLWVPKSLLTCVAGISLSSQEKALRLGKLMLKEYDFRKTILPHI
ncbi:hypothetical protein QL285_048670 [Trifolium repens]|nr:hypothetical protein QL285_048670 [Trifolium repens]